MIFEPDRFQGRDRQARTLRADLTRTTGGVDRDGCSGDGEVEHVRTPLAATTAVVLDELLQSPS